MTTNRACAFTDAIRPTADETGVTTTFVSEGVRTVKAGGGLSSDLPLPPKHPLAARHRTPSSAQSVILEGTHTQFEIFTRPKLPSHRPPVMRHFAAATSS